MGIVSILVKNIGLLDTGVGKSDKRIFKKFQKSICILDFMCYTLVSAREQFSEIRKMAKYKVTITETTVRTAQVEIEADNHEQAYEIVQQNYLNDKYENDCWLYPDDGGVEFDVEGNEPIINFGG